MVEFAAVDKLFRAAAGERCSVHVVARGFANSTVSRPKYLFPPVVLSALLPVKVVLLAFSGLRFDCLCQQ